MDIAEDAYTLRLCETLRAFDQKQVLQWCGFKVVFWSLAIAVVISRLRGLDTQSHRAVTHPSTNRAQHCLTFQHINGTNVGAYVRMTILVAFFHPIPLMRTPKNISLVMQCTHSAPYSLLAHSSASFSKSLFKVASSWSRLFLGTHLCSIYRKIKFLNLAILEKQPSNPVETEVFNSLMSFGSKISKH